MASGIKVSGAWKEFSSISVKVSGAWKASTGYIKVGGAWKEFFSALDAVSLSGWSAVSDDFGAPTGGNNEDRTLTWTLGGARNFTANYAGSGTLKYRINAGSWTTYVGAFSVSSGQTLAWQYISTENESGTITVTDATRGASVGTFAYSATGYP